MRNKVFTLIGIAALVIATPAQAGPDTPFNIQKAHSPLPFTNTPRGVQEYANNYNWGARKTVVFSDVESCYLHDMYYGYDSVQKKSIYKDYVSCRGGYVEITDPLGSKICELNKGIGGITWSGDSQENMMNYSTQRCSMR